MYMTKSAQRKQKLLNISGKIGIILSIAALLSITWVNLAEPRIDSRIEKVWDISLSKQCVKIVDDRMLYMELLLKEIATPEQKNQADVEYKRIKMQQRN